MADDADFHFVVGLFSISDTVLSGTHIVRTSMARLDRQPGQYTSSHGIPARTAQRIVGDHSGERSAFHRSTTRSASFLGGTIGLMVSFSGRPLSHQFGSARATVSTTGMRS